jgi:hypothetical protein
VHFGNCNCLIENFNVHCAGKGQGECPRRGGYGLEDRIEQMRLGGFPH